MIKILNTVLCIACFAGVAAIIITHTRSTDASAGDPEAYFGGGSAWATVSAEGDATCVPENPFVAEAGEEFTAGALTPAERAQAVQRWQELQEIALTTPVTTTAPNENTRARIRERKRREAVKIARRNAMKRSRKIRNRSDRRTHSLFEQTSHYKQHKQAYENSNYRHLGGLPSDRRARSRYR